MASKLHAPSIIATCKQTRFYLHDDKASGEVDIQGLNMIISASQDTATSGPDALPPSAKSKTKGKSKSKNAGIEILANANLRLKSGVHYGLVGRNGTGKSTILRAIADKLIPGLSDSVKISILQQTDTGDNLSTGNVPPSSPHPVKKPATDQQKTVLQQVLGSDKSRSEVHRKIEILSKALEDTEDQWSPVCAIRQLRHEDREHEFFLAQKNASLRSGTRGLQARKDLKTAGSKIAESAARFEQKLEDIEPAMIQEETEAAVDLLDKLQAQYEAMRITDIEQEARKVLFGLGFKESSFEQPFESLSGGWQMRCMLAGALIQHADIMILDEPTNFLDLLGVIWLENYLTQTQRLTAKTIVLVSHDRDFMNTVCEEIIVLKDQDLKYFKGNITVYEEDLVAKKLYWGRMKEAQDRQKAHMEATIRDNIKLGKKTGDDNKLRMAKSRQKKVDDRMGVQVSATGGRFKLNRDLPGWHDSLRAEIEVPVDEKGALIEIPDAPELRFPGPLVSLEAVDFRYKQKDAMVLSGIDLVIHMGDRVGIMGVNGCGKTTLLRLLVGSMDPSQGTVSHHPRTTLGYYSQHSVEELKQLGRTEPALTALSLILRDGEGGLGEGESRGLLSSLGLFGKTASNVPVSQLSGGQLVRLALARILLNHPHILILDEITTHLDFHTVVALAEALSSYNGALLIVSHDRYLIRTVIEGKRDPADDTSDAVGLEDEEEFRRRDVYVLKSGSLNRQENGVEQFEKSLDKRVKKMLAVWI